MIFYKFLISYDGTGYYGWQEQKGLPTISGLIKKYFKRVFHQECTIVGASRTDAGVHAHGQVVRIRTELIIEPSRLHHALGNVLPPDIIIREVSRVNDDFHPYKNVAEKTYYYHFFIDRPNPFVQRFGWYYPYPFDIEKLKKTLAMLVGTYDFAAFATDSIDKDTIRTIDALELKWQEDIGAYRIIIVGKSFLHHMIRRIVGATLEIASRDSLAPEHIQTVLNSKKIDQNLQIAPAKGLCLYEIIYNKHSKNI